MNRLEKFTDNVLAKILGYESEPLLGLSLFLCGNTSFNLRLKHSALKEVRTAPLIEELSGWIRLFPRFDKLEVVNISARSSLLAPEHIAKFIRMWPSGMKEIRLAIPQISQAFLQKTVTAARTPAHGSTETNPDALLTIWKIIDFFPQLEVLQLNDLGTETLISLRSIDMGVFPRELKILDWQCVRLLHGDFSGLPRRMRTLKLAPQASHSTRVLATLPPALTHLSGIRALSGDAASFLPRTLGEGDWLDRLGVYNMDIASALPRVKHLSHSPFKLELNDFTKRGVDWVRTLQRSLVTLTITAMLTADQIAALPRTLTSVKGISTDSITIFEYISKSNLEAAKSMWPPKLRTLCFSKDAPAFHNGDEITTLPKTLTVLQNVGRGSTDRESESVYHYMSQWPPHLTDLTILENKYRRQEIQLARNASFPEGLIAFRDRYSRLTPACFPLFPKHMTTLCLGSVDIENTDGLVEQLPPNLTTFKIGEISMRLVPALRDHLPHLTRLTIGYLTGSWEGDAPFKLLPENITKLSILRSNSNDIPPDVFSHVNECVTSLKVRRSKTLLAFLNHIPETVTDLRVRPQYVRKQPLTAEVFLSFPSRHIPWIAKNYATKDDIMALCDAHWPADTPRTKEIENFVRRRAETKATLAAAGMDIDGNPLEEAAHADDDSDSDVLDL